jgi:tetratricopeptide (TPR) repeat protein
LTSTGLAQETKYSQEKNRTRTLTKPVAKTTKNKTTLPKDKLDSFKSHIPEGLSSFQQQARLYRQEGLRYQQVGMLEEAMTSLRKAMMVDPAYVEPYNDLAVIYEMMGWQDQAVTMYLKALEIDPDYLATYSNLAAFYEERGDLRKAADYWKKRVRFGLPDDYWTLKAREHLEGIGLVLEDVGRELKEGDIIELIKDVEEDKEKTAVITEEKPKKQEKLDERKQKAAHYLKNAKIKFQRGNITEALNDAAVALHFDPSNSQIDKFIEEVHDKLRETKSH